MFTLAAAGTVTLGLAARDNLVEAAVDAAAAGAGTRAGDVAVGAPVADPRSTDAADAAAVEA